MGLLRACLMEVRARRGDWDTEPEIGAKPVALSAGGVTAPSSLGRPLNLPEPLPRKARNFSDPAAYIPA